MPYDDPATPTDDAPPASGRSHPLAPILVAAADGHFPPVDGGVEILPPDAAGTHAVVEFTGHSFVLTDLPATDVRFIGLNGYGGATSPTFLESLAGPMGWIGSLDMVMVRRAGPAQADPLPVSVDMEWHPRVRRARRHRAVVQVYGDDRGVVCFGTGLVGRTEISVEASGAGAGGQAGRNLVLAGLANRPIDELVWAQVSPGNAASVRTFLACGFVPVGSEVLMRPGRRVGFSDEEAGHHP